MANLKIDVRELEELPDGVLVLISGHVTSAQADQLQQAIEVQWVRGKKRFVLDFRDMPYTNSSGLSWLVRLADKIEADGGGIAIANLQSNVRVVFDFLQLSSFFRIFPSVATAVAALQPGGSPRPEGWGVTESGASGLDVRVRDVPDLPDAKLLELEGAIDSSSVVQFHEALENLLKDESKRFILDFEAVNYVNSTGLNALIRLADALEQAGGGFAIAKMQSKTRAVFDMLGLHSFFTLVPSVEEAIEALQKESADPQAPPQ